MQNLLIDVCQPTRITQKIYCSSLRVIVYSETDKNELLLLAEMLIIHVDVLKQRMLSNSLFRFFLFEWETTRRQVQGTKNFFILSIL